MVTYLEQNGVGMWLNDRGYVEAVRLVGDDNVYHSGDPEFAALVAQFNQQTYYATAW